MTALESGEDLESWYGDRDQGEPPPEMPPTPPETSEPQDSRLGCDYPGCDFTTASAAGLRRHQTNQHSDTAGPAPASAAEEGPAEVPPSAPRPGRQGGMIGRLRDRVRRTEKEAPARSGPAPAKAKARGRGRISLVPDLTDAWYSMGRRLERTPYYPTGRMLVWQAPGAGQIIDTALAGGRLDRMVIQPMWRTKDRYEDVFYLIGPPMLLAAIQSARLRQQAAADAGDSAAAQAIGNQIGMQQMLLESMLRSALVKLAPQIEEANKRMAAEDEAIRKAFPDLPPDVDPVQALLSDLFRPPGSMNVPSEEVPDHDGH